MKLQQFVLTLAGVLATLPSLSVAIAVPNAPGTPDAIEEPVQVPVSVDESDIPEAFQQSPNQMGEKSPKKRNPSGASTLTKQNPMQALAQGSLKEESAKSTPTALAVNRDTGAAVSRAAMVC
ncbi:MAG: hypothetical protein LQ338_006158 [Usnochroma carphineum]|nr:MAG: hypothetical protein LQ338_006158 [Usnochroma carphineum]